MAKLPQASVILPANLVKAAKSRTNPSDSTDRGQTIRVRETFNVLNETTQNYRRTNSIPALIRHLAKAEGPISSAVHSIVSVANSGVLVTAFNAKTHEFDSEGTWLAKTVLASFGTLYDYTAGFSTKKSLEALLEQMLREVTLTGALAAELVLDQMRLPTMLQIVPSETLEPAADGKGSFYPTQKIAGKNDPVNLNIPTFWWSFMASDAGSVAPYSMLQSALKTIIYFEEFMEDIRRTIRQTGHTRTTVTLDSQKILNTAPSEIKRDPVKLKAYFEAVQAAVQAQLEALSPEQALILFDTAKAENLQSGLGSKMDYTPMLTILSGLYATSMKTPPSAIGMRLEGGSQALGNIESLIFIKGASAIQGPVEEVLSRAMTLSCRLYGADVYVEVQFNEINLRPSDELEAFKTMRQTRILEQLSLGLISDDYAAHLLGTGRRPAGAKELSGTMFMQGGVSADPNSQPLGDTAMGRTLQPDKEVPRKGGGSSQ